MIIYVVMIQETPIKHWKLLYKKGSNPGKKQLCVYDNVDSAKRSLVELKPGYPNDSEFKIAKFGEINDE